MHVCVCGQDDEGKTGPFLTEVKKWLEAQKAAYIKEIKEALQDTRWELCVYLALLSLVG